MRPTAKILLAYALVAGGPAAITPFAALWLRSHGVAFSALGAVLAMPLVLRLLIFRPLSTWAERSATAWMPVGILMAVSAGLSVVAYASDQPLVCIAAWSMICVAANACTPLMDAAILSVSPSETGLTWLGRSKGAGSLGYLLAVSGMGFWLGRSGPSGLFIWSGVAALGAAGWVRFLVAPLAVTDHTELNNGASMKVDPRIDSATSVPRLALAVLAATMIEASHGLHSVAMINWHERGFSPQLNGILWATGTLSDVVFLWMAGPWRRRLGPSRLLVIGAMAATIRWIGFASAPALPLVFVLQALHALSFTATYLASVEITQAMATRSRLGSQIANWAMSTGVAGGFSVAVAAPLYGAIGADGYWVMALVASGGLLAAVRFHRVTSGAQSRDLSRRARTSLSLAGR